MHNGDQFLKSDKLGRVRTPAARREELLDEFERSGVAATRFAQMVGIKYQTFASWMQKCRRQCGGVRRMRAGRSQQAAGLALRLVEAVARANPGPARPRQEPPPGMGRCGCI